MLKKSSLLSGVLGGLCILISLTFFTAMVLAKTAKKEKFLQIAAIYFAVGLILLIIRWVLEIFRNKASDYRIKPSKKNAGKEKPIPAAGSAAKEGSVLLIILGVLAVVTVLVYRTQVSALYTHRRDENGLQTARLRAAATDAAKAALVRLAEDQDLSVDNTNEPWASSQERKNPSGITTYVAITDQDRYFCFNNVLATPKENTRPTAEIIMDIMTLCGDFSPVRRVDALQDWVDEDSEGYVETKSYEENDPPYAPPNRELFTWNELLWIRNFNREMFNRHPRNDLSNVYNADFIDCFTVIPRNRTHALPVNINTAGENVLQGIFGIGNEELVRNIMGMRMNSPFRSLDPLYLLGDRNLIASVRDYLDVRSHDFLIDAMAYKDGQTEHLRVLAHRNNDGNVKVLQWVY